MKIIDKIALNRLIKILTDFILALLKIFAPKDNVNPDSPLVPKPNKPMFPWLRKNIDNIVPWRKKDE